MRADEYRRHDAVALVELVAGGEVTPSEVLEAAVATIDARNPALNAVVIRFEDAARGAVARGLPRGRFHGVPFLLKDLDLALAGQPLTHGSRLFQGFVPDRDSTLVARYKAAGLVILGRTNSAELGLSFTTEPLAYGPTRHPQDPTLSPGGSSGGAAAAVAAGMVPMAHGTDGGGSIRQPAALCGLFGLKPSRGRTPAGPDASETFFGLAMSHALTRSVRDSAALLDATAGFEPGALHWLPEPERSYESCAGRDPPRLRIALQRRPFNGASVDPLCLAAVEEAARLCEDLGHHVEDGAPDLSGLDVGDAAGLLSGAFTAERISAFAAQNGIADPLAQLEPLHAAHVRAAMVRSAPDLVAALATMRAVERRVAAFFTRADLILSPVIATPSLPLGWLSSADPAERDRRAAAHAPFTTVYNRAGVPAMSVPFAQGRTPVGVQFAAALGREDLLFGLAGAIERARPWVTA
ncbi:amidase [Lichenihabitans sp. Uapishka_5]|uniref:amidase n=1 Tax=Lichenihabitans sp. Uapishka_5 TaxID=3037302 RepID=UPI0029E7E464|nr:amidase [Lichenihabitans sp. Uapishka_5]MDX7951305.1 amidase [Lichenihabitans sp. Uapishka_5]